MNYRNHLNGIIAAAAIAGFITPKQKRELKKLDSVASHAQEAAEGEQWEKITLFREEIRALIEKDDVEIAKAEMVGVGG